MKEYPPMPSKQMRNSSIELYRIVATLTVLIVHFNGWFVGGIPDRYDFASPSLFRTGQMIIEASTCICVNMFIIISGYFGIKLKLQSVIRICLLLALIFVPLYIWNTILSHDFRLRSFVSQFFVISRAGYFIQCYMMLMFLSPVLNAFINCYGKMGLKWVLVFFTLEIWFGCIKNVENLGYNQGYSVIHFVLIYMLARYIRLYESRLLKIRQYIWIIGYLVCTMTICLMYIVGIRFCWDYSNPIVIISSVCSFVPFLYSSFYNKIINWIAGGSLAVYIIQVTNPVYSFLVGIDNDLLKSLNYPSYLFFSFFIIVITFLFSVLYGKCCDYAIKPTVRYLNKKYSGKFEFN
jgi:hypothetical protein